MKQYLLTNGQYFKMSPHTHSTCSDGKLSPEEVKEKYMEKGYSIVAYTDHDLIVPQNALTDAHFVAITAMEFELVDEKNPRKVLHFNLLAKDQNRDWTTLYNPKSLAADIPVNRHILSEMSENQKKTENLMTLTHTTEGINRIIARAKEEGFLVAYNHPNWSCHHYDDYIGMKGLWGVEWYNDSGINVGRNDNQQAFEDLLNAGENVFPIAADDMHDEFNLGKGFLMVAAEKLEYGAVMKALEAGEFYSSTGPLFKEVSLENGVLHVETDRSCRISVCANTRLARGTHAYTTSFETDVTRQLSQTTDPTFFIRVNAVDETGREAHTRAFWLHELSK